MREPSARRLAWVLAGLIAAGIAANLMFGWLNRSSAKPSTGGWSGTDFVGFLIALPFLGFPVVGLLLALKRPRNWIGWIMLGIGLSFTTPFGAYATYALRTSPGSLPGGALSAVLEGPSWIPLIGLSGIFLILLFPDGHLPSPRWRWFARAAAAGMVVSAIAILLTPGALENFHEVTNPLGVRGVQALYFALASIPLGILGAAVSLVHRYRRSSGPDRVQLKWLAAAAAVVAAFYLVVFPLSVAFADPAPQWLQVLQALVLVPFGLIPIAIGFSVLKYRLYDIDLVINRAVLYASLAIFISLVYVAIVVGIGAIVGSRADPILSAAAAAVVALAFQPARHRAQRLADRLVYGKRATPYEVLSEFSERLGGAFGAEDLLPRMARILVEGTGAERADVWVKAKGELRVRATSPVDAPPRPTVDIASLPPDLVPVRHQGELLGAISIQKRPGESVTPTEEKLVADLASQAGLVLKNAALIEDLRTSRQRLVRAQDEERRRLERNIHDGAQQQLVALAVKLGLADQLIDRDPGRAHGALADIKAEAATALQDLRDLARGIYPPLLADKGLAAALEAQARKSALPITIEAERIGRFSPEIEAAVYFSCLEALQNVVKHSNASKACIRLVVDDGSLRFQVEDDGTGFDPTSTDYGTGLQGMGDRLDAIGGRLAVRSAAGEGTTVTGQIWTPAQ